MNEYFLRKVAKFLLLLLHKNYGRKGVSLSKENLFHKNERDFCFYNLKMNFISNLRLKRDTIQFRRLA